MRRFLRGAGIGLAWLLGLVLVAGAGLYINGARRLQRHYDVRVELVAIPTDSASLALSAASHRSSTSLCGVHNVRSTHLQWTRDQLVTTIRTGVRPDGYKLNTDVMPNEIFHSMTDDELGAIWAYLGSLGAGSAPRAQPSPPARRLQHFRLRHT